MKQNLNIISNGRYPADVLSNFAPNAFELDGIACASMEGFLQSLKFRDNNMRIRVAKLVGFDAKMAGRAGDDWKSTHTLYWRDEEYYRHGREYQELLTRAFDALVLNPKVAKALLDSYPHNLIHAAGTEDANKTILTPTEFTGQLTRLRANLIAEKEDIRRQFLTDLQKFEEICKRNDECQAWLDRLPEGSRTNYRNQIAIHRDRDALIEIMHRCGTFLISAEQEVK